MTSCTVPSWPTQWLLQALGHSLFKDWHVRRHRFRLWEGRSTSWASPSGHS
ncbi:hypothetical protein SAMN05421811_102277 [Nonomuraea wenchangensis]|uniref:Uncharacterized protein n=1 Tax=Nonomuraea wenchangensis TaxID=568860 RepID=A0A1I0CF79_9ACTN|nr:hypothetical protein SAMN05421811_102277 [Nonomuraea wenchangensis]